MCASLSKTWSATDREREKRQVSVEIHRRRFTVDDYYRMADVGILKKADRVELIEGEVVTMSPNGPRHAACVGRAGQALTLRAVDSAIIRIHGPVRLTEQTEPEPDLAVLRPKADFYASGHPGPTDILLIVEVADSSLDYDRKVKTRVYAESGIREYWVADLPNGVVFRYTDARDGTYQTLRESRRGERIAPELLAGVLISVEDLLGD